MEYLTSFQSWISLGFRWPNRLKFYFLAPRVSPLYSQGTILPVTSIQVEKTLGCIHFFWTDQTLWGPTRPCSDCPSRQFLDGIPRASHHPRGAAIWPHQLRSRWLCHHPPELHGYNSDNSSPNGLIFSLVAELLRLKERGQKCDTYTHHLLRSLSYGRGLKMIR